MERGIFEMYWSYYLSLEDMYKLTSRYVAHAERNKLTYSDEFTKIILLSCSEIDSLLKVICECKNIAKAGKYYNMTSYAKALECSEMSNFVLRSYSAHAGTMDYHSSVFATPFDMLDSNKKNGGLSWWEDYQKLKHNRLKYAEKGNLLNATNSMVALYILICGLGSFLDENQGGQYVQENYRSNLWIPVV